MQTGLRRGTSKLALDLQRVGLYANIGDPLYYAKTYYFATDDPVASTGTLYYSDGVTWTAIAGTKTEIARATLTSNGPSTSAATGDITGLSITFTLATARTVRLELTTLMVNSSASYIILYITDPSNVTKAQTDLPPDAVGAGLNTGMPPCWVDLDLAAGTYTYKARQQCVAGTIHTVSGTDAISTLSAIVL